MEFGTRELFTDIMQDAILSPEDAPVILSDEPDVFSLIASGVRAYREKSLLEIEAMDWVALEAQFSTEDLDDVDGDNDIAAKEHTIRLTAIAFDDSKRLLHMAAAAIPQDIHEDKEQLATILHQSKHSLLQVARITDEAKQILFNYARATSEQREMINQDLWDLAGSKPLVVYEDGKVAWAPDVESWIRQRIHAQSEERGCPAHKRTVKQNGHATTLINKFWDNLIDLSLDIDR